MVSTTPTLEGHRIVTYHGIVTGHAVAGTNFFRDWLASIRDVLGGRSRSYEKVLRAAERSALEDMVAHAKLSGANAVVGVDLDFEAIKMRGQMLMVVATGTAVEVEPESSAAAIA